MSGALDSSLHIDEDVELGRRKTLEAGLADPVGDSLLVAHRDQALVARALHGARYTQFTYHQSVDKDTPYSARSRTAAANLSSPWGRGRQPRASCRGRNHSSRRWPQPSGLPRTASWRVLMNFLGFG